MERRIASRGPVRGVTGCLGIGKQLTKDSGIERGEQLVLRSIVQELDVVVVGQFGSGSGGSGHGDWCR